MSHDTVPAVPLDDAPPGSAGGADGRLLNILEELNGIQDAQVLVDRLCRAGAELAGYESSLITMALPEGSLVGTWNIPDVDRLRFMERARRTDIDYRRRKREHIRSKVFPGTGIAFISHDSDLPRAPLSEEYSSRRGKEGTWHPDDRLFVLVTGSGGEEVGVFSLDFPSDGQAPRAGALGRLLQTQRLMAMGGSLVESRVLQQGLKRREAEFRTLVENAPVGIYRRDREGHLLGVNRRLATIFGYATPGDLLTDREVMRRIESPAMQKAIAALGDGETMPGRRVSASRVDGREVLLQVTVSRSPDRDEILGIVEDVTESSALEDHLQRARRLDAVGTLASGIAHDFNNLLCGILGYASMMREDGTLDHRGDKAAKAIEEAAERGADLTRRLLGISRDTPDEIEAVDVEAVLQDCARIADETFDRRIALVVNAEKDLPRVVGRRTDLHQCVLNLCINARDAMDDDGHLELSAGRCEVVPLAEGSGVHDGPWVRITVKDNGCGMDEATRERVFEPFFTTKPRGKGTGLGLYMVFSTMAAHGGIVDVQSAPGEGTTISISLPAMEPERSPTPAPASRPIRASDHPGEILLVEDEGAIRTLFAQILKSAGHTVRAVPDGLAAVKTLENDPPPDVVILDLVLPGLSGHDVFRALRKRYPDLPVILSSGNVDDALLDPELREGIAGVLRKPYRPALLAETVDRVLAEHAGR